MGVVAQALAGKALWAVAAQFSQAIASFLLSVLAYRYMGQSGLGVFALIFGLVVLATAVVTGLVGDALTVLDRADPGVRAALQRWLTLVVAMLFLAFAVISPLTGKLGVVDSLLLAAAAACFVIEDTLRRWLMAVLRFRSLVVVDVSAAVVSIGLVVVAHEMRGDVTITTFIVGLLAGQLVATGVAVAVLPADDRWLARGVEPDMRAVWNYGAIRSAQQMLRPGMMTLVRVAVIAVLSASIYGQLEAARVYVAPAMLTVSGAASFLFASYAREKDRPMGELVRRADRAVLLLVCSTALLGVVATFSVAYLGTFVVDDGEPLSELAVLGWVSYAAASASVTPYGSLAAVRGRQLGVLAVRIGESVCSVIAVLVLLVAGAHVDTVPFTLAAVSLVSGLVMRLKLLPVSGAGAPAGPQPITVRT